MMKFARVFVLSATVLSALPAFAMSPAQIQRCQALSATFASKQANIVALQEARDALAEETESLGEAWELVEEQRNFSGDHAAQADAAQAVWTQSKTETLGAEQALQTAVLTFNQELAAFNAQCVTD